MKKEIKRSMLLMVLTTTISMSNGMYVGGGVSIEDADTDDSGMAVELSVGKVFYNNFGIEGKLTKTVSSPEDKNNGIRGEVDIMTISLFATYSYALSPELTIMPKIGFTQFSTDLDLSDNFGNSATLDDSNSNLSFGVDVKYKMSMDMNLYVGYTKYKPEFNDGPIDEKFDASHLSVGIQKKF